MLRSTRLFFPIALVTSSILLHATDVRAATPTAAQALQLTPIQADVDYERPSESETAKCSVEAAATRGIAGWVVKAESGRLLRRFLDTNADNKIDQWCYYKDGVEVYRDVDGNFNGKADQYRWLGTAGIRWGVDRDEDGRIDVWKAISAEEVTAELVAALRDRDAARFERLLLTPNELKSLGLGDQQTKDLTTKVGNAIGGFKELARQQQVVANKSEWVHFGGTQPGVVPAGSDGSTKDLIVYDNVAAVIETDGKHAQVAIGTLIRVDDTWRLIDLPKNLLDGQANAAPTGFFFQASLISRPDVEGVPESGISPAAQKLIAEFEQLDTALAKATSDKQIADLHARRADVMEQLIAASSDGEQRANWIRQFADIVSAAMQNGAFADGGRRLTALHELLAKDARNAELAGYVKFRYMTAAYTQSLQQPMADYAKIQDQWLESLKAFVSEYPQSPDAAEAMLQLALAQEFAGQEDEAKKWYGRIATDFVSSPLAQKATGATRRLDSVGKPIDLRGKATDGTQVDLNAYRGRMVLIHYWATWCEPCKQDLEVLKRLQAKYATQGFSLIGISLDNDAESLANYLKTNRLPWPQLYEPGGLDGRFANELGILTLPTMLLIDKQGKVLSRNMHAAELDTELGKQLR
jgi:thiol-disulfide isomerase/thioredoxin